MIEPMSEEALKAGLPSVLASPQDHGSVAAIVIRPANGERRELQFCEISLAGGAHGDNWINQSHRHLEDGSSHPDVQICMMNSRCIDLIAQTRDRWALAGDNLFLDLDLSPENLPVGQRLAIGSAVVEITDEPHLGCGSFAERYGAAAVQFVNNAEGRALRLRGVYARVVVDGPVSVGDAVKKSG